MPTIQFNPQYILDLGTLPFPILMWRLFLDGMWVPMLLVMIQGLWLLWVQSRTQKYGASLEFVLLAIHVPKTSDQTPKAAEQIFSHLAGTYGGLDPYEKYWEGKFNPSFSFELVSIGGYVQYYIHCPKKSRDLVESSIYAQYPDAEIFEVPDYTTKVPSYFPDPEWEASGTEYVMKKASAYPIRTYADFEHASAEVAFKDPISALLEMLGSLRPGEQFWMQIRVTPSDESWQKKGQEEVDKMLGKKKVHHKSLLEDLIGLPMDAVAELTGIGAAPPAPVKKEEQPRMLQLSPRERTVLEAVQEKLSKIGFMCKIRVVYVAHRNVFNKGRLGQLRGTLSQFQSIDMNGFKGYGPVTPKGDYVWQRWSENEKKTKLMKNYKGRSGKGASAYALNIEELATLWHFPMTDIKAPLVMKTEAKRAEPPAYLPMEGMFNSANITGAAKKSEPVSEDEDDESPGNLPVA